MEVMNSIFLHFSLFSEDVLTLFFFCENTLINVNRIILGFYCILNEGRHENICFPELVGYIPFKISYTFSTYLKLPQAKPSTLLTS